MGAVLGQIPFVMCLGLMGALIFLYFLFYEKQSQKILRTGFYAEYFLYLCFIALNFIACPEANPYALYEYVFYLLIFFAVCYVLNDNDFESILRFYEAVGVVLAVEAVVEFVTGWLPFRASETEQEIRRACGLLGTPLTLGTVMACIALISFYLAARKKSVIHYVAFALCVAGLLVTQSRGPLVAFIIAFILMLFLIEYKKSGKFISTAIKNLLIVLAVLIVLVFIVYLLKDRVAFVGTIFKRFQTIFMWGSEEKSNTLRQNYWQKGFKLFMENPILGYGVSSTGNHSDTGIIVESGIIKKLVETGIIGFVLYYTTFGIALFKSARRCIKAKVEHYPVAIAVITAVFVENMVLQTIESLAVFMLFIVCFTYLFTEGNKLRTIVARGARR